MAVDVTDDLAPAELLSIGDLEERTGISADTIRAWERRYGEPVSLRLPSGHRRYTPRHVRRLRRVAEGLAQGHRPSRLLDLDESELDRLLGGMQADADSDGMRELLELVRGYDRAALRDELMRRFAAEGLDRFLSETVAALIERVGRAWADGELEVRHEHCMSEVVEDVLRSIRLDIERAGSERRFRLLLTTLPGETHDLGLQMAALVSGASGADVRLLGTDTPLGEIAGAVRELDAQALGLSISLATGGPATDRVLRDLRAQLPQRAAILVGGAGARRARRGMRGITYFRDLDEFGRWVGERARR